jgi:hypothetical protein
VDEEQLGWPTDCTGLMSAAFDIVGEYEISGLEQPLFSI